MLVVGGRCDSMKDATFHSIAVVLYNIIRECGTGMIKKNGTTIAKAKQIICQGINCWQILDSR